MDNYYSVVSKILNLASKQNFVQEVHYGDAIDWLGSGDHKYCSFCVVEQPNNQFGEQFNIFNFVLYIVDRLEEDNSNLLEVHSNTKTIGEHLLRMMPDDWTIVNQSFTPFKYKFADLCAGNFVTISLQVPVEFVCEDDAWEPVILKIDKNGEYNLNGYDTALVDVHSTDVFNYFTLYPSNYIYANYLDLSTEIVANVKFTGDEDFYFCSDEKGLIGLYYSAEENETYAWWDSDRLALHFHKRDWDKGYYKIQFKAGRLQIGYLTWTLNSGSSTTSFDPLYFGYYKEKTSPMEIEYITISNQYGAAYDYRPKITDEYAELVEVVSGKIADIRTVYTQEDSINMDSGISFKGSTWNTVPYKLVGGSNRNDFTGVFSEMAYLTELDVQNVDFSNAISVANLFQSNQYLQKIKGLETLNFANSNQIGGIFQGDKSLGSIDISKWNVSNAINVSWLFGYSYFGTINVEFSNTSNFQDLGGTFSYLNCEDIIGLNSWNTDNITTLAYTFDHFSIRKAEKKLDLSSWTTPNLQTLNSFMQNDASNEDMLTWVDIHNFNCSQVYDTYAAFEQATRLSTIIGDHSIEEVENGSITALKGLQTDINLSSTNLERPSLLAVIKGVAEGAHTLSLGPLKSRLTEVDIQLATNKGWTIN